MSSPTRLATCLALSAVSFVFVTPSFADPDKAAHVLAERFASDQERTARQAEESEILKRAREEKLQREANEKAIAARKAALEKKALEDETEAKKLAEQKAEEQRVADQKAEAERQTQQKLAAEKAEAGRKAAELHEREVKEAEEWKAAQIRERLKKDDAERLAAEEQATKDKQKNAEAERRQADKLQAGQRAESDRKAADARQRDIRESEERKAAEIRDRQKREETERVAAEERAASENQRKAALERQAESDRISEKLKRAREQRIEPAAPSESGARIQAGNDDRSNDHSPKDGMALGGPPQDDREREFRDSFGDQDDSRQAGNTPRETGRRDSGARVEGLDNVTVLLVMEPGHRGIRRFNHVADPVLCVGPTCYVSTGADAPARAMPRRAALGPINTFGKRAGACRRSLTCVFRGIDLSALPSGRGDDTGLQPVDLKVLIHDRRTPVTVTADSKCHARPGHLTCARLIKTATWTAWIVPEAVAREAGSDGLLAALKGRLTGNRAAALIER